MQIKHKLDSYYTFNVARAKEQKKSRSQLARQEINKIVTSQTRFCCISFAC